MKKWIFIWIIILTSAALAALVFWVINAAHLYQALYDLDINLNQKVDNNMVIMIYLSIIIMICGYILIMLFFRNRLNKVNGECCKFRELASRDSLTKLLNRNAFEKLVKMELTHKAKSNCVLIIIDIDNFKKINDNFGHICGDNTLCMLTEVFKSCLPPGALLCRFGGDEFSVFIKNIDNIELKQAIDNILIRSKQEIIKNGQCFSFSCSIGIVDTLEGGRDFLSLYCLADRMLYKSKEKGKNRATYFSH